MFNEKAWEYLELFGKMFEGKDYDFRELLQLCIEFANNSDK